MYVVVHTHTLHLQYIYIHVCVEQNHTPVFSFSAPMCMIPVMAVARHTHIMLQLFYAAMLTKRTNYALFSNLHVLCYFDIMMFMYVPHILGIYMRRMAHIL